MEAEPDHPILPQPWTYDLIRIDWRPTPAIQEALIDLTFRKGDVVRRLRFTSPTSVKIDEGFQGQCFGLKIIDIRSRSWDGVQIQVVNFEPVEGITFFAKDVFDLDETEGD